MKKSESIKNLAASLAKFNSEVSSISKDAKNPFFKSDYVTLDKLILSTRDILQKNGLSVLQFPVSKKEYNQSGNAVTDIGVQTILLHESGEYIESEPLFVTPSKQQDAQAAGSIISYIRRYSYQAILNLNTGQDDDANYMSNKTINPEELEKYNNKNNNYSNNYNNNYNNSNNSYHSNKQLTDKQIGRIYGIANSKFITQDVVAKMISAYGVTDPKNLSKIQYDELCDKLEKSETPITDKQLDTIRTLMKVKGLDKNTVQNIVLEVIKVKKASADLTENEATMLINHLLSLPDVA